MGCGMWDDGDGDGDVGCGMMIMGMRMVGYEDGRGVGR